MKNTTPEPIDFKIINFCKLGGCIQKKKMLNSKELHKDDDYKNMVVKPIESGTLDQLGRQHPSKGQDLTLHKQEVRIN